MHARIAKTTRTVRGLALAGAIGAMLAYPVPAGAQQEATSEVSSERLAKITAWAELHLAGSRPHQVNSKHFTLISDTPRQEVAVSIARNLEAAFTTTSKLLAPVVRASAGGSKVRVYVYEAEASFKSLSVQMGAGEFADGLYDPTGLMAFYLEQAVVETLMATMIHETVHVFLDQRVVPPGASLPIWINEGFASYIGNSPIEDGELKLHSYETWTLYHGIAGGRTRQRSLAMQAADDARKAFKAGNAVSVHELLTADSKTFYGDGHTLHYAESYLFVYFLCDIGGGWESGRFPALMRRLVDGEPAETAIRAVYGLAGDVLEQRFRAFVKEF